MIGRKTILPMKKNELKISELKRQIKNLGLQLAANGDETYAVKLGDKLLIIGETYCVKYKSPTHEQYSYHGMVRVKYRDGKNIGCDCINADDMHGDFPLSSFRDNNLHEVSDYLLL